MTAAADVVVVGAGLAAATRLVDAGAEVVVLEARDRVGGRTLTLPAADGTPIDHGGHWIGPTQDRIAALAERVGATSYPNYGQGLNTELRDGRVHRYGGQLLEGDDPVTAVAIGQAIRELEAMAATVPLEAPWTDADALAWDSQTAETWLQARVPVERARAWLRSVVRGTLAAEPGDASLLHTLFFIRSGGGIARLIATDGPQERCFHQGAQTVSTRVAEWLGERVVLDAPAAAVRHGDGGWRSRRPAMPGWRNQLTERVPMGSVVKFHALYDEPFWRHQGLSGFAVSDSDPVGVVYDTSPEAGSPGVLVGFIEGAHARAWARRDPAERRAGILARLTDFFGEPAGRPRELLERSWADDEYSGGCYAGYFPPGSGPPSARPSASPWAASTGPAPRPPPPGPPTWRARSRAANGPPTRSWPRPSRGRCPCPPPRRRDGGVTGRGPGRSGPRPGRPGAGGRRGRCGPGWPGRG